MFYLKIATLSSVALFCMNKSFSQNTTKDNQNLNEVIIQSSRLQIQLSEQNRNVDVINAEEIKKLPAKSVNEILSYVSGVDIRQRGPFGTQSDVSIDGGSFEQTLVLLNGVKISDHQTAHNTLNIPIPVESIERIEILRGPAARVYGVNSLTGAINIVTKTPEANALFLHAFGGSNFKNDADDKLYNGRGLQLGTSIAADKHGHQVFGSHESGTGYRYNTAYQNNKVFYQGEVNPNQLNKIDFLAGYASSSFGANGFYAAPGDIESKEIVSTTMASIRSKHQLNNKFTLSPQVGYRYNYDDYRYFRNDLSRARSQHYTHAVNAEINGNYQLNVGDIGFGLESRYEQINSNNIGEHERENYGLYSEFRTSKIENVNLNVGAYLNYNSVYGWQIFPGIDLSYQFTPGFKAVFNTGTSQRIPSFTDLYLDQRPGNIGNANLSSETAYQIEGGFKYQTQNWQVKAILFFREIDDFIDWTRDTNTVPWQANNVGQLNTTGFNFQTQYNFNATAHAWNVNLGYTYLSPEFKNQSLTNLSKYKIENLRHQVVARVGWQHKNWSALIAERYLERISYKNYMLTDIRLNLQQKQFDYYVDFQNVFDKTYIEAGAVPMPGRWFSLGVKYHLGL
jgi:vitamin B12 transporter